MKQEHVFFSHKLAGNTMIILIFQPEITTGFALKRSTGQLLLQHFHIDFSCAVTDKCIPLGQSNHRNSAWHVITLKVIII